MHIHNLSENNSVLNTFISYTQQLAYQKTGKATTSTGFIPINVSLNMTGMSGMKIYQTSKFHPLKLPTQKCQWANAPRRDESGL